ncbi:MAG: DUF4430 domain-containing protein [Patescibacteria group bacterium]
MNNRLVNIALYILIAAGIFGLVFYFASPAALTRDDAEMQDAPGTISVSLTIDRTLPKETHEVAAGTSALFFLTAEAREHSISIAVKEYAGMGKLVEGIGDLANGTDGKYWHYYVNGALAPVGAAAYVLKEGDAIEWRFHEPDESL